MPDPRFVLDTSAWLTLIEEEPGADVVADLLERAARGEAVILSSFVAYTEVEYITLRERGREEAETRLQLMEAVPVLRVESTRAVGRRAAALKAATSRAAQVVSEPPRPRNPRRRT